MRNVGKRSLAWLLSLIMIASLLPVQAFAVDPEDTEENVIIEEEQQDPAEIKESDIPYCLLVTHVLKLDGMTYGQTEMAYLKETDFQDGVYDIHNAALSREGLRPVKASYMDMQISDLVESWTVDKDSFEMGGDPDDGSAYYAAQLLIEYDVASGYKADVSQASGGSGEYDAMPLTAFTGGDLGSITFIPAEVVRLTLNFEYSRTGGMAGASAADSAVIEITKSSTGNAVDKTWELPSFSNDEDKYSALEDFRIVLDPTELNSYLVDSDLANKVMGWTLPFTEAQKTQLDEALEEGRFNVQTDPTGGRPVYWANESSTGDKNPTYNNRYSTNYNKAWDEARVKKTDYFTAEAVPGSAYDKGANKIPQPQLKITITQEQWNTHIQPLLNQIREAEKNKNTAAVKTLQDQLDAALTVTVFYRRNASFYNVRHLVPPRLAGKMPNGNDWDTVTVSQNGEDVTYSVVFAQQVQGRAGALTNAKESPEMGMDSGVVVEDPSLKVKKGTNQFDFGQVMADGIRQTVIKPRDEVDGTPNTTVDIIYKAAEQYRLIFDTNDAYIPRQQVTSGTTITFNYTTPSLTLTEGDETTIVSEYKNPTRAGYTFRGWGYRLKTGTGNFTSGDYQCKLLDGGTTYTVSQLINDGAYITNSEAGDTGVKSLMLYPWWTEDNANVRVVFWTENLDRTNPVSNDVSVSTAGTYATGDGYYNPGEYLNHTIKTNDQYSNMGSYLCSAKTDSKLTLSVSGGVLTGADGIEGLAQAKITSEFTTAMGEIETYAEADDGGKVKQPLADFYTLHDVKVTNDATVGADGATVVNLYYKRNIYTAQFIYYGTWDGDDSVAIRTNGYAIASPTGGLDDFGKYGENQQGAVGTNFNRWSQITATGTKSVPQIITIKAKYGADLSDVWPVAKNKETMAVQAGTARMISWTPTSGPYNQYFHKHPSSEPTIMGIYHAMGADIISDPQNTETYQYLYAYWDIFNVSHYRNNHCYEVPGLTGTALKALSGVQKVNLYNNGSTDADSLYLLPITNQHVSVFADLMKVRLNSGAPAFEGEDGYPESGTEYYAVRVFNDKCYAVAGRVTTVSTNFIAAQNPSARLHLTRVPNQKNNVSGGPNGTPSFSNAPDHTSQYGDGQGAVWSGNDNHVGEEGNPYDLYFYYTRNTYKIIYTASSSRTGTDTELGTITVPYGVKLSQASYGFNLDARDNNNATAEGGGKKYPWTTTSTVAVCPDRAADGTATWTFGGWFQNRALSENAAWDSMITGNVRLYAGWNVPGYTVTFHLNGSTLDGEEGIEFSGQTWANIKEQRIPANTSFTASNGVIPRPTRKGWQLEGWYVVEFDADNKATVSDTLFNFDAPLTKNYDVAAKWKRTVDKPYFYRVWHLTEDAETAVLPGDITPTDDTGTTKPPTAGKSWHVLGGTPAVVTDYKKVGDELWLAASAFPGYVPLHPNHAYTLTANDTTQENPADYFFYYNKATLKEYNLKFVLAGEEGNDGAGGTSVIPLIPGEASESVYQPSFTNVETLKAKGYRLVKREGTAGNYTYEDVEPGAILDPVHTGEKNGVTEVTYLVKPIQYNIRYVSGSFEDGKTEVKNETMLGKLSGPVQAELDALTVAKLPEDVDRDRSKNPGIYNVRSDSFTVNNPSPYVRINVGTDAAPKYQWWKFAGWSHAIVNNQQAQSGDIGNPKSLEISQGSVGNLAFRADWTRIDEDDPNNPNTKSLVVSKDVALPAALQGTGVTAPDEAFEFTVTLAGGNFSENMLMYKVGADGSVGENLLKAPYDADVTFTLKKGERMEFDGLPAGSVTVTETTTGAYEEKFDAVNPKNYYYTVNSETTKQDVSQTGTISATSTVKTEFTNYYHPTVWLDTDNDPTNGNMGFPVYKHLLDNEGKEIGFFGGNTYTILVRAGAQSPAGTPLPNLAQPTDTDGSLGLPSTQGDRELTRSFDAVRFEQPGTYYYLFREMGPDSSTAVPGVSYDPTRYRVTVVVGVDATGNNLTCRITRLQKLVGSSEGDGPDAGWTEVVSAAENASLDLTDAANPAKRIVFHNTYSETEVSRAFKPKKELKGRKEPLQAGEFTFTLTAVGSHNMTQAEAELYHDVGVTNDDRLDQLKRFNNWTADGAQPMPGGKYAQTVKEIEVKNDSSGAIVLGSITYTADNMGEQDYGKVYKYTLTEKVPAGAVDGKFKGITYDTETRTLYVYVHLHYKAAAGSALAPLGASDTLVYARRAGRSERDVYEHLRGHAGHCGPGRRQRPGSQYHWRLGGEKDHRTQLPGRGYVHLHPDARQR